MFWNRDKVKATWKAAFKLTKDPNFKSESKYFTILRNSEKYIELFDSRLYREKRAYLMAQENNFLGSPEFYWRNSNEFLDLKIRAMRDNQHDLRIMLQSSRFSRKMRRDLEKLK